MRPLQFLTIDNLTDQLKLSFKNIQRNKPSLVLILGKQLRQQFLEIHCQQQQLFDKQFGVSYKIQNKQYFWKNGLYNIKKQNLNIIFAYIDYFKQKHIFFLIQFANKLTQFKLMVDRSLIQCIQVIKKCNISENDYLMINKWQDKFEDISKIVDSIDIKSTKIQDQQIDEFLMMFQRYTQQNKRINIDCILFEIQKRKNDIKNQQANYSFSQNVNTSAEFMVEKYVSQFQTQIFKLSQINQINNFKTNLIYLHLNLQQNNPTHVLYKLKSSTIYISLLQKQLIDLKNRLNIQKQQKLYLQKQMNNYIDINMQLQKRNKQIQSKLQDEYIFTKNVQQISEQIINYKGQLINLKQYVKKLKQQKQILVQQLKQTKKQLQQLKLKNLESIREKDNQIEIQKIKFRILQRDLDLTKSQMTKNKLQYNDIKIQLNKQKKNKQQTNIKITKLEKYILQIQQTLKTIKKSQTQKINTIINMNLQKFKQSQTSLFKKIQQNDWLAKINQNLTHQNSSLKTSLIYYQKLYHAHIIGQNSLVNLNLQDNQTSNKSNRSYNKFINQVIFQQSPQNQQTQRVPPNTQDVLNQHHQLQNISQQQNYLQGSNKKSKTDKKGVDTSSTKKKVIILTKNQNSYICRKMFSLTDMASSTISNATISNATISKNQGYQHNELIV